MDTACVHSVLDCFSAAAAHHCKLSFRYKKRHASGDGIQAGGWFGALLSGSLGMLPLVNFGDQDTGYDSYRIPKRCSMSEHAKETERSA